MDSSFWLWIVHYAYLGVSSYDMIENIVFFLSEDLFTLTNSEDPDEMQHYGISSGSSLLLKVPI